MKNLILILITIIPCLSYGQINMTINTDPSPRKAISPYIYGVNAYIFDATWGANPWKTRLTNHGNQANIEKMNVTSFRIGGNATSALNWENGANNAGIDDSHKNSSPHQVLPPDEKNFEIQL